MGYRNTRGCTNVRQGRPKKYSLQQPDWGSECDDPASCVSIRRCRANNLAKCIRRSAANDRIEPDAHANTYSNTYCDTNTKTERDSNANADCYSQPAKPCNFRR